MKVFRIICTSTMFMVSGCVLLSSCSESEPGQKEMANSQDGAYLNGVRSIYRGMMDLDLRPTASAKAAGRKEVAPSRNRTDSVPVYLEIPDDYSEEEKVKIERHLTEVVTTRDLIEMAELACVKLTTDSTRSHDGQIVLSELKAREAIAPLVAASREYLRGKGFSDVEIEEMLEENGVDESELVRLVLYVSTDENASDETASVNSSSGIFSLLSTPAYAATWQNVAAQAGSCAFRALVADLEGMAFASAGKVWSKAAMRIAFKSIAKKALGPVGVAIAVGEFGYCMWG